MNNHGGKRRGHRLPALSPADVATLRNLHSAGWSYKRMMKIYPVSRETLRRAIYGISTYKGWLYGYTYS